MSRSVPRVRAMLEVSFEVVRSKASGSFLLAGLLNGAGSFTAKPFRELSTWMLTLLDVISPFSAKGASPLRYFVDNAAKDSTGITCFNACAGMMPEAFTSKTPLSLEFRPTVTVSPHVFAMRS
nr:hypothetical protein [Turicimonas muris]